MGAVQFNRWRPNRWDLLTLCILAVVIRWPWLAVLAFLFADELHVLARRVLRLRRPADPPAMPPPSGILAASSLGEAFQLRRGFRMHVARCVGKS
jgi:hypothetical protein